MAKHYVIGIDQGISNTGICVMDIDGNIIETAYIQAKQKDIKDKVNKMYTEIYKIFDKYKDGIRVVVLEQLIGGGQGMDTIHSNITTGILYTLAIQHNKEIIQYYPVTVKKEVTGSGRAKKQDVINTINNTYKNYHFNISHEADAVAIALTYIKKEVVKNG